MKGSDYEVFDNYHRPNLQQDEARHSLILSVGDDSSITAFNIGEPGQCALLTNRSLILGNLIESQCHWLADRVYFPKVIGPDDTTSQFVEHSTSLGFNFVEVEKHIIWSIKTPPIYPKCPGHARLVEARDLALMLDWLPRFQKETNPHDSIPTPDEISAAISDATITLWIDQGEVVAMAGSTRRLENSGSITGVYTPPELRGHGYAGAATAAMVERIYQEGRKMVCLYTDSANIASHRCYEKIGFEPVCRSAYWIAA